MLKVNNVSKSYNAFRMQDINMELPKGYIMGLVGRNGAGKTTLLRMIAGMNRASGGSIIVNGLDIYESEENAKKAKNDIGFVLHDDLFIDEATLLKNGCVYGKYYSRFDKAELIKYCEEFDLDINKKFKGLSKGEKLKFQFAFALSHSPKLLLLDEPAGNFDTDFRKKFLKILTDFVSDGEKSIVIATHLTEDLDRIGDYVTFIDKGTVRFSTDREELSEKYRLISGETSKCNLINKKCVIYREDGKYGSKLLVDYQEIKGNRLLEYLNERQVGNSDGLTVEIPTIEDIMYYVVKGDKKYV